MGDFTATASPTSRRVRPRRPTPGSLIVSLAVGVNLVAVSAVAGLVLQGRAQARAAAVVSTQNVAQLLDEGLSAAFDRVDLALAAVQDELEQAHRGQLDGEGLDALLARQKARTPDLQAIRILDPTGLIVRSAPPLAAPVRLGDREYFEALRGGAASVVSRPISGRISKVPIMIFARRVAGADGRFAGAVLAVIDLQHVVDLISRPDMGPHGAVALRADDLSLVARTGPGGAAAALSQTAVSAQMQALRGRREATFDARSPADGTVRTYSFRWLAHHPFIVVAGLAPVDYLAGWRRASTFAALLLAGFVVLTSLGAWLALHAWRRQQRAEEELARFHRVESLAVLAGGIAHDFNNLLTGIAGNVSLAREAAPAGSVAAEALADAEAASMRARALAHQLLTFARGGAPVKRRVDLSALVEEAARFAAHGAGTALQLETAAGVEIEADPGQIAQVVQNLVLNGIQAMASRGTLVVRTARELVTAGAPRGRRPGPWAVLSVEDGGPGIAPEVLPHIFDPFFTTKVTGKGLGLAISHSIVAKHDGLLEVTSPPSGGATFQVWLPALGGVAPPAPAPAPAAASLPAAALRILVMDDEAAVRRLVARLLRPAGYDVVEARDGEEAVARYAEAQATGRPFAAVLMDLTIPGGVGGLEALGRLRQLDPQVAAVVCSGYSNDPVMARWAEHGFRAFLGKPYVAAELRETLARVLGR
jgi:signal transduction histidine kinase/ActR/RegA family two-component response regulator